jgi:5-(hydroxymethyl)furfural/furfural oxidase
VLLRAGIGPVAHLRDVGIEVRAHVPGVGQRLMDHPSIAVASYLDASARANPYTNRTLVVGLRFSSGLDGAPSGDLALTVSTKSAWHAIGDRIASMTIWVNKTYSDTGQVQLASADWRDEPRVDFNLLSDQRDLLRLMSGFRRIAALHELAPLKSITSDAFPASFSDKIRKIGDVTLKNRILTSVGAVLLDGPAPLRRFMIRNFIMDATELDTVLRDYDALEAFIRRSAVGVWHASCSCRMCAENDPMAVTDPSGRVRAVQGLRVHCGPRH